MVGTKPLTPDFSEFMRLLDRAEIPLPTPARKKLWRFHELLREADRTLNLTRIKNFEAMVEKHYIDSLLPWKFLQELPSPLMDLGSGAGLPGIPLAIASPETLVKLVEARKTRALFLFRVVERLALPNVEVIARKLHPSLEIPVAGVITRAFAPIAETLPLLRRSLKEGGIVILMKGPRVEEELRAVDLPRLGYTLKERIEYLLPFRKDERVLLILEKVQEEPLPPRSKGPLSFPSLRPEKEAPLPPARAGKAEEARNEPKGEVEGEKTSFPGRLVIRSPENPRYRHWRKLLKGRGVHKWQETLLFGRNYVQDLLSLPPPELLGIIHPEGEERFAEHPVPHFWVSPSLFRRLDPWDTASPVAWLKTRELLPWNPEEHEGIGVVLLLQNPQNLGGALRTLAGMGIREILLTPEAASPFHPRTLRGSGPIPYRVPLYRSEREELLRSRIPLYLLDPRGTPLRSCHFPERFLLVLGSEGQGVSAFPHTLPRVALPMGDPGVESLNATVALALALNEILRRRHGALQESP